METEKTHKQGSYTGTFNEINCLDARAVYAFAMGVNGSVHLPCPRCGSKDNLSINTKTNHFHCFGGSCSDLGEMSNIDLLIYARGLQPYENRKAAQILHNQFFCNGVPTVPMWEPSDNTGTAAPSQYNTPKTDTNTKSDTEVDLFLLQCLRDADGDKGLTQYLNNRGFTKDICRIFDIYNISRQDYYKINSKLKSTFAPERLKGLAIMSEGGNFRFAAHRIIFAVRDARGRLTGFKGRAMPNSKEEQGGSKYMNTTPRNGYNLSVSVAPNCSRIFLVEGEFDADAATVLGAPAVSFGGCPCVAPNSMEERLLKYCEKNGIMVSLCFDNDERGKDMQKKMEDIIKMQFPKLAAKSEDITEIARLYVPHLTDAENSAIKDFADILRYLNGDKRTAEQRESNIVAAEGYCTEGTHDINDIADRCNMYPYEIRRGYMDLIALYGCYFLTFTNDYQQIKIHYDS